MSAKYSDKIKELELVGQYVDRLGMIESNLSQDVDEGKIDKYVLTLLTYCIDRINRVYIEGEKKYNDDCCEYSASAKDEMESRNLEHLKDIVTQGNESNENGGI